MKLINELHKIVLLDQAPEGFEGRMLVLYSSRTDMIVVYTRLDRFLEFIEMYLDCGNEARKEVMNLCNDLDLFEIMMVLNRITRIRRNLRRHKME